VSTADRAPGDRIGDYRLDRLAARTAGWEVWEASHVLLPRAAMLRVSDPALPEVAVRLLREAWLVEALLHPGMPRVFDCGRLGAAAWIATEPVAGESLADRLAAGAMTPVDVAALIHDVGAILEHAHRRGVVHGDLNPSVIVLTDGRRGWPMCIDSWAGATASDDDGAHPADLDVAALGAIGYHALVGAPLDASGAQPVAEQILRATARRAVVTTATADLARLIDTMVCLDPDRRPTMADARVAAMQLATALERELAESADLAIAMLAVDDIADRIADGTANAGDDTMVIEAMLPGDDEDITPLGLDAFTPDPIAPPPPPDEQPLSKMRAVKWTPPYGGLYSTDPAPQVDAAGEIDTDPDAGQ
jgi:hypothetical protein